jgi:DNA invertase Pin-like site-specific DNA recombinase
VGKKIKAGSPLLAVAYIRVSKDEQKLGPDAQQASIEAWAAREGIQVAAWCPDPGVSSVTPVDKRPGLMAALVSLREHGAGVLVVAKRDRIARDPMLTRMIEGEAARRGAVVISAAGEASGGTAPADVMMRGVVDLFAEYERGLIRARTKAALAVKKARGEKTGGGVPYGYRRKADGQHATFRTGERRCQPGCLGCRNLEPFEAEQAVIVRARELRAKGVSLAEVSEQLEAAGHLSRTGKPFVTMQISRICG